MLDSRESVLLFVTVRLTQTTLVTELAVPTLLNLQYSLLNEVSMYEYNMSTNIFMYNTSRAQKHVRCLRLQQYKSGLLCRNAARSGPQNKTRLFQYNNLVT